MKCFLDIDGVLVDFLGGACEFHKIPYSYNEYPFAYGEWDVLPPPTLSLSTREFWDVLDADFWANLDWMPDGKDMLALAESVFGEENICLLTCPTLSSACVAGKIDWIQKNLPKYSRRYLIGPPKHFCAHDNSVLIDDRDRNVEEFVDAGGYGILLPRPWNSLYHLRKSSWRVLEDELDKLRYESTLWKD